MTYKGFEIKRLDDDDENTEIKVDADEYQVKTFSLERLIDEKKVPEEFIVFDGEEQLRIFFTKSMRGKPAMIVNGIRYIVMSENQTNILWRCSYMATKTIKCPARISMAKHNPPKFTIKKSDHIHAEIKRGKYVPNPKAIFISFENYSKE